MKITVDAQRLHGASQIAKQVTARALQSLTTLKFMQLKAEAGKITVRATDLEKMVWINIPGEADMDGEISLPIKHIVQFTRKEKGKVAIEDNQTGDPRAIITGSEQGGSAKLSMETTAYEDRVPDQELEEDYIQTDLGTEATRALAMAATCAATDESRPVLTGVLLDSDGEGTIRFVAADGFRLLIKKLDITGPEFKIIVPGKTAQLVSRVMAKKEVTMWHNKEKARVVFQTDDITINAGLIQGGTFPDYFQLIPAGPFSWVFECSAPLFQQRVNQYTPDASAGIVRLIHDEEEQALKLEIGSMEGYGGHLVSLVPATLTGEGKTAANQLYLTEAIKLFSAIKFEVTNPSSPMVITGDVDDLTIVIMPMFVQW